MEIKTCETCGRPWPEEKYMRPERKAAAEARFDGYTERVEVEAEAAGKADHVPVVR